MWPMFQQKARPSAVDILKYKLVSSGKFDIVHTMTCESGTNHTQDAPASYSQVAYYNLNSAYDKGIIFHNVDYPAGKST